MDAGIGGEFAVDFGEQGDGVAVLDVIDPSLDDCTIGDVGAQEEQVVDGQVPGEIDNFVGSPGSITRMTALCAVAQFELDWIRAIGFYLFGHLEPPRTVTTRAQALPSRIARKAHLTCAKRYP